MLTKHVAVTPFYGWGWTDSHDAEWDAVPSTFAAEVERGQEVWHGQIIQTLRGSVNEPSHVLHGFSVLMSPRHSPWDGHVNVELKSSDGRQLNGFASIDMANLE